jgi:glyoxylase-like metal-dependent hydrolase (beta-lactamase superfamily II)
VGDITVDLRPVNIEAEGELVIYLPRDRILLAGDALEDTATFISEPEHLITQYASLRQLRTWDIDRIFPNHGNPAVIGHGGYQKTLIDATMAYVRRIVSHAHDPAKRAGIESARNGACRRSVRWCSRTSAVRSSMVWWVAIRSESA